MARVELSPKAESLLDEIIRDRGVDDFLLDRLTEKLEEIARNPVLHTEPAKLPYPPNRLMANFILNDVSARLWGFTVTLRRLSDEEGIYTLTINTAPYPSGS